MEEFLPTMDMPKICQFWQLLKMPNCKQKQLIVGFSIHNRMFFTCKIFPILAIARIANFGNYKIC